MRAGECLPFCLLSFGNSCILPVCFGLPFKLPFSNISFVGLSIKKKKIVHTKERKLDAFLYLMMLFCVSGVGYMHLKGELSRDKL